MSNGFRYAQIMGQMLNRPLFAHPRIAVTVYNALCGRFGTAPAEMPHTADVEAIAGILPAPEAKRSDRLAIYASRFEGEMVQNSESGKYPRIEPFMRTRDGVAIITGTGELVNRGAWVGANSGVTSYEGLKFQLGRAGRDPRTKAILLDVESPGGEAVGMAELSSFVRAVAAEKPVYAVVNGMAASAGYGMIAGATRIFNTPSGLAGSIGCVLLHMDMSKALEQKGLSPTLIFAGDHKVDGNPTEPLTDSVKAELQGEVDTFYQQFLGTVAAGRGRRLSEKKARDTQARTYIGQQAVDAGLADGIGTFEEVLSEVSAKLRRANGSAQPQRSKAMAIELGGDVSATDHANAVSAARNEGHAAGLAEGEKRGATAALARIQQLVAHEKVKGKEGFALKLACASPDLSVDAIVGLAEEIPAASAAAAASSVASIADRAAKTPVNQLAPQAPVGGDPQGHGTEQPAADAGWGSHVKAANASRQSAFRR
jgi:signal peptide peptidase SppA